MARITGLVLSTAVVLSAPASAQDLPVTQSFRRGDANDDGRLDISDPVRIILWLFGGGPGPACLDAVDVNDDGRNNISDAVYALDFLFKGGEAIPFPGRLQCGPDPSPDDLGCESYPPCDCGGFIGDPCDEGEYCELPPGLCSGADLPGECLPVPGGCPRIFDPVCGCDGVTYGNDCERMMAGVQKSHDGRCGAVCGGIIGERCEPGQFCDLPPGLCDGADLQGVCVDVPDACLAVFDPVCGCDGVTYGNDCERVRARVQKDRDGPCEER